MSKIYYIDKNIDFVDNFFAKNLVLLKFINIFMKYLKKTYVFFKFNEKIERNRPYLKGKPINRLFILIIYQSN